MSARDNLDRFAMVGKVDNNGNRSLLAAKLDAHRAEVLAADGQAYDGELAMLRSLRRTLRTVVRYDSDIREVRKLLEEHTADDAAARLEAKEKSSRETDVTPDFFQVGHTYGDAEPGRDWKFRVDTITTHPEDGERTALGWRFFNGRWEEMAYGEDDWEIHLAAGLADVTDTTQGDRK